MNLEKGNLSVWPTTPPNVEIYHHVSDALRTTRLGPIFQTANLVSLDESWLIPLSFSKTADKPLDVND